MGIISSPEKLDDFSELWKNRKGTLPDLGSEDQIRFGSHVYILKPVINITETLAALAQGAAGVHPVRFLHLYCRQLIGSANHDGVLDLKLHQGSIALKSLYIFACDFIPSGPPLVKISVATSNNSPAAVSLYCESAPDALWVERNNPDAHGSARCHVLRHPTACPDRDTPNCAFSHFDIDPNAAGISIRTGNSAVEIQSILDVPLQELRATTYGEFEAFGGDIRRTQNLPRLLDDLFTTAAAELMGKKPDVHMIVRRLRFILRCARRSPLFSRLVDNAETLLGRLQLPLGYPGYANEDTVSVQDWFFAPEQNPSSYTEAIDAMVNSLQRAEDRIVNKDRDAELQKLIQTSSGVILKNLGLAVRSYVDVKALEDEAIDKTKSAEDKRTTLQRYRKEMEDAGMEFNKGVEKYKKKKMDDLRNEIIMGVGKCVISIGIAVFTGGAGAPLTVGAFNEMRKSGEKLVKESSKLWRAIKALGETLLKIYPTLKAAMANQESFTIPLVGSLIGTSKGVKTGDTRDNIAKQIQQAAKDVTSQDIAGKAAEKIDYLGLLADWREFDLQVDKAFTVIKEDVLPEKIEGLDEYRLAMKKLAVRGETMLVSMREAYDARQKFLTAGAEAGARAEKEADLQRLAASMSASPDAMLAWAVLKWRLQQELTSLKQATFNMLHEGILALTYETNNVKCQKELFGELSPALSAAEFDTQRTTFKNAKVKLSQQRASFDIRVGAVGTADIPAAFITSSWKDFLLQDLQVPFHVPPTLEELKDYHRIRIRGVYAEFIGLKRKDGSTTGLDELPYDIWLGPLMLDKAIPYEKASSYTVVQYYMPETRIPKKGAANRLLDDQQQFSRRALCCLGWVTFDRAVVDKLGWDLTTVTDIQLRFKCEGLAFKSKAGR